MIYNERQYKITKAALNKLSETLQSFTGEVALKEAGGDSLLAKALLDSLTSERDVLSEQLSEYEALKNGSVTILEAQSLSELPSILVRARIAKGLSQKQLGELIGVKEQQIQRYEAENYSSASLRRLVEIANSLGLEISEKARLQLNQESEQTAQSISLDISEFPLKEMYRRGWFHGFSGNLREAQANAKTLVTEFLRFGGLSPTFAYYRKHVRAQSTLNDHALMAWHFRVRELALNKTITTPYQRNALTESWVSELVKLSSRKEGPRLAVNFLRDVGITLVIEPHLPQTYLDGAAFLASNQRPVIAMTLRYDRLDNFWFVLLHELAHLVLHLENNNVEVCFDDLEAIPDDIEKQADEFASNALIPKQVWESSPARYLCTGEAVDSLAKQLSISPALVAGRIRKEADNYIILKEFIGAGEVRNQFPEVKFGV
jgi:HTH-type transcriptional regulator/antitoxin HigA